MAIVWEALDRVLHPGKPSNRNAIFDVDNTLVNSEELCERSLREVFKREYGINLDPQLLVSQRGKGAFWRELYLNFGLPEPEYRSFEKKVRREVNGRIADGRLEPMPGALELVEGLHRAGIRLGIATSANRKEAMYRLYITGFSPFFPRKYIKTADDIKVWRGKPNPGIFRATADTMVARYNRCVVVEDSSLGAQGAFKAGMKVLYVSEIPYSGPAETTPHLQARSLVEISKKHIIDLAQNHKIRK